MFRRKPPKHTKITVSGLPVNIIRKDVKNINLRVYPSRQEVRISAPWYLCLKVIREFVESKQEWIQRHLNNYEPPVTRVEPQYRDGEIHPYQGEEWKLRINTKTAVPAVKLLPENKVLLMQVRPGSSKDKKKKVLKEWYRAGLKKDIQKLIDKWEEPMGVKVREFGVKQMKTRWGSCNIRAKRIWLNLELAKKSPACLESVVVHEMVHLLERLHNKRFYRLMDSFLPDWREIEKELQGRVD